MKFVTIALLSTLLLVAILFTTQVNAKKHHHEEKEDQIQNQHQKNDKHHGHKTHQASVKQNMVESSIKQAQKLSSSALLRQKEPQDIIQAYQVWKENNTFETCDTCLYLVEGVIFALDAGVVVSGSNVWAFVEFWCSNLCVENCSELHVWEIMLCKGAGALLLSTMAAAIADGSIYAPRWADNMCVEIQFCEWDDAPTTTTSVFEQKQIDDGVINNNNNNNNNINKVNENVMKNNNELKNNGQNFLQKNQNGKYFRI